MFAQITVDYEELRRVIMKMRSHMGGPCAALYWPHSPNDDQPPPPSAPSLF